MKLESVTTLPITKHLIRCECGGCQPNTALGNFKDIAVPVSRTKHFRQFTSYRICCGIRCACHKKKTNLLLLRTLHLGSERLCDQLATQAQTENWLLRSQGGSNQSAFGLQVRIQFDLIGTLPSPSQNKPIEARVIRR